MIAVAVALAVVGAACSQAPCPKVLSEADARARGTARCAQEHCPATATQRAGGVCACPDGDVPVFGACASTREAEVFCGPLAVPTGAGCAPRTCPEGHAVALDRGACVPVRGSACAADHVLVATANTAEGRASALCLPLGAACPRTVIASVMDGASGPACPPSFVCPLGTVAWPTAPNADAKGPPSGEPPARCVPLGEAVDLGLWTAAAFGAHGGRGTHLFCGPIALRASPMLRLRSQRPLTLRIEVIARGNDAGEAFVRVKQAPDVGEAPSTELVNLAQKEAEALVSALRRLGGRTSAAWASTRIRCPIPPVADATPGRRSAEGGERDSTADDSQDDADGDEGGLGDDDGARPPSPGGGSSGDDSDASDDAGDDPDDNDAVGRAPRPGAGSGNRPPRRTEPSVRRGIPGGTLRARPQPSP